MEVRTIADPKAFADLAWPLLLRDEARHNLALGLSRTLIDTPDLYPEYHLWVVLRGTTPVLAAMMTPPFNVVITRPAEDGAIEALATVLNEDGADLPGVSGAVPEVEAFALAWERERRVTATLRMSQRIYRLTSVRPVSGVPGGMRDATDGDRALLIDWIADFGEEATVDGDRARTERVVDHRLSAEGSGLVLWDHDGRPVSLAGYGGRTPNGVRIGPVYTPPELRRRGYASALVAELSDRLLQEESRFCFLYTDLANPTSNKIYVDIGYEPVCDAAMYAFEPVEPTSSEHVHRRRL